MDSPTAAAIPRTGSPHPGFFQLALGMLLTPGEACDQLLRRRRSAIKPLIALIVGFSLLWAYYYFRVDFPWMVDRMIDGAMSRHGGEGNRAGMEAGFKSMTPGLMLAVTMVSGGLSILIIIALRGFYLNLIAKLFSKEVPNLFSWVALSIWAAVPTLLSIVLSAIFVLSHDVRNLMPADIGVASVNNLFLKLPDSHPWAAMANSFDILLVWSFVIMGLGFSRWTGAGVALGQLVAFLPFAALYGIWALFIIF